jgi:hypothetical protein
MYQHKIQAIRQADTLIKKLQDKINRNPKLFKENYGQKEIREFEDKLAELHYVDKCDVMEKFQVVSTMTPQIK